MSNLTDLEEIRDNLIAEYKTVSATPSPDYDLDGQQIDRGKYLEQLEARIRGIKGLIQDEAGPFEYPVEIIV